MKDISTDIRGHTLEYFDDEHIYLIDGVQVPSITEMLKFRFGHKYDGISKAVLNRAADKGTELHDAIEAYCKTGEQADLQELRGFIFLQKAYRFEVMDNEVPVILFKDGDPIAAGRLDLILKLDGKIGGADIKRTSALDKEYLAMQLNLYRIAYRHSYGIEWEFLRGIHLREERRKMIDIPIVEDMAMEYIDEFLKGAETHE